jgi:hypothetical protein
MEGDMHIFESPDKGKTVYKRDFGSEERELVMNEPKVTVDAFDWYKPTVQMLGRWQPWHEGHRELFKRCHSITGQVVIMIRHVPMDKEANERVPGQDDNPWTAGQAGEMIQADLEKEGYVYNKDYMIMGVPNIVDISYGRGVGYTFTEHDLGKDVHNISATKIRKQMREEGDL